MRQSEVIGDTSREAAGLERFIEQRRPPLILIVAAEPDIPHQTVLGSATGGVDRSAGMHVGVVIEKEKVNGAQPSLCASRGIEILEMVSGIVCSAKEARLTDVGLA